jgi:hypothetical protein
VREVAWIVFLAAFAAIWLAYALRYVPASRRWFRAMSARDAARRNSAVPRSVFPRYFGFAIGVFVRNGALMLFRPDPDAEIEALRREAITRARPLLVILGVLIAVTLLVSIAVLLILGIAAILR